MKPQVEEASVRAGHEPQGSAARVPPAAKWLGALGAIPFVFLAALGPVLDEPHRTQVSFALAAYGAVILSFLGGIHWGLAVAETGDMGTGEAGTSTDALQRRLGLSVVPSLIGWGALFLIMPLALAVLAVAFGTMLWFDLRATRNGDAPSWYPKLRWPLTVGVVASLTLGALT